MSTTTLYRCADCRTVTRTDDDLATCQTCDGILFDHERLEAPRRNLRFRLIGEHYYAGDDRTYEVVHNGTTIGTVFRDWLPAGTPDAPPVAAWSFQSNISEWVAGTGHTRHAAIIDAFERS